MNLIRATNQKLIMHKKKIKVKELKCNTKESHHLQGRRQTERRKEQRRTTTTTIK